MHAADRVPLGSAAQFQVRVMTQELGSFSFPTSKEASAAHLLRMLMIRTALPLPRLRLIYRGRVLQSEDKLGELGVDCGHVLHLTVLPENSSPADPIAQTPVQPSFIPPHTRAFLPPPASRNANRITYSHEELMSSQTGHRYTEEDQRMLQDLLLWQRVAEDRREFAFTSEPEFSASDTALMERERESMEILMGLAIGFMLGFLATFCIINNNTSRRLKLGILIGVGTNTFLARIIESRDELGRKW